MSLQNCMGTAKVLAEFAKAHGLADDWHAPDGVTAKVVGRVLDNTCGDFPDTYNQVEEVVVLRSEHETVFVNLATVLALAASIGTSPEATVLAELRAMRRELASLRKHLGMIAHE